jgi:peptidoglycan/LPS O-acetylase OafA/YrhL
VIGELGSLMTARGLAVWALIVATALAPHLAPALLGFLFLLSGFTVYLSSHSAMRRHGVAATSPFLRARLLRLAPGMAAAAGIMILAGSGQAEAMLRGILPPVLAMTLALMLLPVLAATTPLSRLRRPDLLGLMMVTVALLQPVDHFVGHPPAHEVVRLLLLWSAGAILCAFWLRGPDGDPRALAISSCGMAASGALGLTGLADPGLTASAFSMFLIQSLAHASAFRRNPLHRRSLRWLGRTSYTAWLAHLPIAAAALPAQTPLMAAGYLLATLAATLVLAPLVERRRGLFIRPRPAAFPKRRPAAR